MNLRLLLKINFMLIALGLIFATMHYLRSPEFLQQSQSDNSPLGLLLGANPNQNQELTWCPQNPSQIIFVDSHEVINDALQMQKWCRLSIAPTNQDDISAAEFKPILRVEAGEKSKILEMNARGVFRVEGMPFKSLQLEQELSTRQKL